MKVGIRRSMIGVHLSEFARYPELTFEHMDKLFAGITREKIYQGAFYITGLPASGKDNLIKKMKMYLYRRRGIYLYTVDPDRYLAEVGWRPGEDPIKYKDMTRERAYQCFKEYLNDPYPVGYITAGSNSRFSLLDMANRAGRTLYSIDLDVPPEMAWHWNQIRAERTGRLIGEGEFWRIVEGRSEVIQEQKKAGCHHILIRYSPEHHIWVVEK